MKKRDKQNSTNMETKKLKKVKVHEIDTQDSEASNFSPDSPKKKTKNKMQGKKKVLKAKPKNLKSKACVDNSKKSKSIAYKRTRYADIYDDIEDKFSAMEQAERTLTHLENGLPHFLKCMLPSNVSHGFWLHLPSKFCALHLPGHDASILLVDEWGNEYKTSYLLERHGLSAGWRGFSVSHRLLKGDILIFHLTEPCKMKVHIVRVNTLDIVDAALCLMDFGASSRGTNSSIKKDKRKKTKFMEPFLPDLNVEVKNEPNSVDEAIACPSAVNNNGFISEGLIIGMKSNCLKKSIDLVTARPLVLQDEIDSVWDLKSLDMKPAGSENAVRPQSSDLLCYSGVSFLHDHPRELLTCT